MDETNLIDPEPVAAMRTQEEEAAQRLREEIARLQEQLAVREARIAVLDEVLSSCKVALKKPEPMLEEQPPPPALEPVRQHRATASSMEERRDVVVRIFEEQGDMTPREMLPLVNEMLGEELVAHQLRAVLRKYKSLFESRPDRHGIWGLR